MMEIFINNPYSPVIIGVLVTAVIFAATPVTVIVFDFFATVLEELWDAVFAMIGGFVDKAMPSPLDDTDFYLMEEEDEAMEKFFVRPSYQLTIEDLGSLRGKEKIANKLSIEDIEELKRILNNKAELSLTVEGDTAIIS